MVRQATCSCTPTTSERQCMSPSRGLAAHASFFRGCVCRRPCGLASCRLQNSGDLQVEGSSVPHTWVELMTFISSFSPGRTMVPCGSR